MRTPGFSNAPRTPGFAAPGTPGFAPQVPGFAATPLPLNIAMPGIVKTEYSQEQMLQVKEETLVIDLTEEGDTQPLLRGT